MYSVEESHCTERADKLAKIEERPALCAVDGRSKDSADVGESVECSSNGSSHTILPRKLIRDLA